MWKNIVQSDRLKECHPRCAYHNFNGLIINNGSQNTTVFINTVNLHLDQTNNFPPTL